jgi:hypothetical protein
MEASSIEDRSVRDAKLLGVCRRLDRRHWIAGPTAGLIDRSITIVQGHLMGQTVVYSGDGTVITTWLCDLSNRTSPYAMHM